MDRWYPNKIFANSIDEYLPRLSCDTFTTPLINELTRHFAGIDRSVLKFAEFGVWQGATTGQLAKFLNNKGELHLFDYEDTVQPLKNRLEAVGFTNITAWGCSFRYLDSYNWSLRACLAGFLLRRQPSMRATSVVGGSNDFG